MENIQRTDIKFTVRFPGGYTQLMTLEELRSAGLDALEFQNTIVWNLRDEIDTRRERMAVLKESLEEYRRILDYPEEAEFVILGEIQDLETLIRLLERSYEQARDRLSLSRERFYRFFDNCFKE